MKLQKRYLTDQVLQDVQRKMVFVGGPRQVGKTTMAQALISPLDGKKESYMNWDVVLHREAILKQELPNANLWIFDGIHKYKDWRNYLKGLYDQYKGEKQILVTGSARLDYYRRGGDSLQGRYHYLRLGVLSTAELGLASRSDFEQLFELGGFPEPFFGVSQIEAKRWSREYRERLIQEDLLGLEQVRDLGNLELLMVRLPELVASPLSINAIREDMQVSHKAVSNWLDILERLYAIYRLSPFGVPKLRAVKKEQKHYHYDWTLVEEPGARFENMVASHLLKWVHFEQDTKARELELRYFRDVDGREVDFVITERGEPIEAIECKLSDGDVSRHLKYFRKHFLQCKCRQISYKGTKDFVSKDGIRVQPALHYLKGLV